MRIEILDPATEAERIERLLAPESGYRLVDAVTIDRVDVDAVRFVVYPWRRTIVRLPDSETFRLIRATRNRHLIDDDEQRAWSDALIGITGLSVGASALSVCSLSGARRFRLAEYDTLGMTNLNRLAASVCDIGTPKLAIAQRRVFEIDPYSSVEAFPEGYSPKAANAFLGSSGGAERLAVLLEEMDDLAAKVDIRRKAKTARIPVLMVTDNGDNVILDVERFDLDPEYPLFHGRAGDLAGLSLAELRDPRVRVGLVSRIVGEEITPRTRFSLTQVGRTLPSWPQLGTAATLAGATAAYATRLVATGQQLPSGRYRVDLDRALLGAAADTATQWNELDTASFRAAMSAAPEAIEDK